MDADLVTALGHTLKPPGPSPCPARPGGVARERGGRGQALRAVWTVMAAR